MAILHNWATGDDEVMEGRYDPPYDDDDSEVDLSEEVETAMKRLFPVFDAADIDADVDAAIQRDLAQRTQQND